MFQAQIERLDIFEHRCLLCSAILESENPFDGRIVGRLSNAQDRIETRLRNQSRKSPSSAGAALFQLPFGEQRSGIRAVVLKTEWQFRAQPFVQPRLALTVLATTVLNQASASCISFGMTMPLSCSGRVRKTSRISPARALST